MYVEFHLHSVPLADPCLSPTWCPVSPSLCAVYVPHVAAVCHFHSVPCVFPLRCATYLLRSIPYVSPVLRYVPAPHCAMDLLGGQPSALLRG